MKAKTITKLGLALGLAAFAAAPVFAQIKEQPVMPPMVSSQTNHLTATVAAIDYPNRKVTLKGPDGNSVQVTIGDDVKNFSQIKKGDQVNIGYFESIALSVRKPGETLAPTGNSQSFVRNAPGQKPGSATISVSDVTATVQDVDQKSREVSLKGPDGNIAQVYVDPSVGNLDRIKKGDQVTVSRTEAMAVSIDAPNSSPK